MFCSIRFYSTALYSILSCSFLFSCNVFYSIPFYSILMPHILRLPESPRHFRDCITTPARLCLTPDTVASRFLRKLFRSTVCEHVIAIGNRWDRSTTCRGVTPHAYLNIPALSCWTFHLSVWHQRGSTRVSTFCTVRKRFRNWCFVWVHEKLIVCECLGESYMFGKV